MKKALFVLIFTLYAVSTNAEIVYLDNVKVNEVSVYDDWEGGIILVGASSSHSSCPKGQYIKPSALTYEHLYSAALAAGAAQINVRFQLYTDRKIGDRCEIDAIRHYF